MSATVNKLVYGDLTFTDDEIQDGEVYDAVALLSDALEIGTINVGLYISCLLYTSDAADE